MITLIEISFAIVLAIIYFLSDYLKSYKKIHINYSLVTGISLSYFFFDLLPEITHNVPEIPYFEILPYFNVLLGFSFQYIFEKLIIERVDRKAQQQVRKLMQKENFLELKARGYETTLTREVAEKTANMISVVNIVNKIMVLQDQEKEIKTKIKQIENKISSHISKILKNIRFFDSFTYEFLIGLSLLGILSHSIVSGVFFFIFTFIHSLLLNKEHHEKIFSDLDIDVFLGESHFQLTFSSIAMLLGVNAGIILNLFVEGYLEITFIFLSIMSGIILYEIVQHMPRKDEASVFHFLIGIFGFGIIYIVSSFF